MTERKPTLRYYCYMCGAEQEPEAARRDLIDQLRSDLDGLHSDSLPSHSCGKACFASLLDRQIGDSPVEPQARAHPVGCTCHLDDR